ncbi:hypothetical protein KSS87_016944 [Heliosperma pusillum]|nr:hypothetical protein KSS87_016944 [Heliosperma pusillum]
MTDPINPLANFTATGPQVHNTVPPTRAPKKKSILISSPFLQPYYTGRRS